MRREIRQDNRVRIASSCMKTVNILGAEYTIEHLKREEDRMFKNGEADGYCDSSSKRIVLRMEDDMDNLDDYSVYLKKLTRHEIIHAFLFESGLGSNFQHKEWGHEETMVDWIAYQFPKMLQVFKDAECL